MKNLFVVLFVVAFAALSNTAFAGAVGGDPPPVVPEPVSTTLFLLGGAALAIRRLHKK